LGVTSNYVDEDRAYELKTKLEIKHRTVEIIWGGILVLCLSLTMKGTDWYVYVCFTPFTQNIYHIGWRV